MRVFLSVFVIPVVVLFSVASLPAMVVELPISIDYPLLRSLVTMTYYTEENQSVELLNEGNGCRRIVLSEPDFFERDDLLVFQTHVSVQAGVAVAGKCVMPLGWSGYLEMVQEPIIDENWILGFITISSNVLDENHEPAHIAGIVWKLIQSNVHDYIAGIRLDLSPPLSEVDTVLDQLYAPHLLDDAKKLFQRMLPGKTQVTEKFLKIIILADVDATYEPEKDKEREKLDGKEREELIHFWEVWDAYLVGIITMLASEPLTDSDRQILLDTLLEARYQFVENLEKDDIRKDFVRKQFVDAWENLSPIFRRHLNDTASKSLFSYLAFYTASDALMVLDRLGPGLGIEISRNGLIRLIRMLRQEDAPVLEYNPEVDADLLKVLGISSSNLRNSSRKSDNPPSGRIAERENLDEKSKRWFRYFNIDKWFVDKAHAQGKASSESSDTWIVPEEDVMTYVDRVTRVMEDACFQTLSQSELPKNYSGLFERLSLSTAWQESCFRQFVKKGGQVKYLISYNGTSVGIMQINERVWRGIYDLDKLRWDIHYNANAGCQILDIYFNRYALRKIPKLDEQDRPDNETIARLIYAMYNGGPSQFSKFLDRSRQGNYYLTDRLFWEKYQWVKNEKIEKVTGCLIGR